MMSPKPCVRARAAFDSGVWSRISPRERGEVLIRWADLLEQHRDEMALLISLEMGKPVSVAWNVEMKTTIGLIRWYGELADKLMDESPRGKADALALVTREPMGVVAAITPWNFPMTLSTFKMPAALVAGNTVVLKPASQSPLSVLRAAELASRSRTSGRSAPSRHRQRTGHRRRLGHRQRRCDPDLHRVRRTWASSSCTTRPIPTPSRYGSSSEASRRTSSSPMLPTWRRPSALRAGRSAFNSGQMCTAGFTTAGPPRTSTMRSSPESPNYLGGADASATRWTRTRAWSAGLAAVTATTSLPRSARASRPRPELVLGSDQPLDRPGWFVGPAVFTGVQADDRLAQHEIFGPVLSVLAFNDEDEAIAIANNSDYGLGSAVWTANLSRAARVLASARRRPGVGQLLRGRRLLGAVRWPQAVRPRRRQERPWSGEVHLDEDHLDGSLRRRMQRGSVRSWSTHECGIDTRIDASVVPGTVGIRSSRPSRPWCTTRGRGPIAEFDEEVRPGVAEHWPPAVSAMAIGWRT